MFADKQELEAVKQELSKYKVETDMTRFTQNGRVTELETQISEMKKQQDELMKLLYKNLPRE